MVCDVLERAVVERVSKLAADKQAQSGAGSKHAQAPRDRVQCPQAKKRRHRNLRVVQESAMARAVGGRRSMAAKDCNTKREHHRNITMGARARYTFSLLLDLHVQEPAVGMKGAESIISEWRSGSHKKVRRQTHKRKAVCLLAPGWSASADALRASEEWDSLLVMLLGQSQGL